MSTAGRFVAGRRGLAGLFGLLAGVSLAGATVTFDFDGQTLSITASGNGGDNIVVAVANGQVTVNGTPAAATASIVSIEVLGSPGDDTIDLVTIDPSDLPALTSVTIDGGGGADQIFGSQADDTIIDDDGGDSWVDQGGDDTYIISPTGGNNGPTELSGIGAGNDTLVLEGTSGDDVFKAGSDQASVNGRLVTLTISQLDGITLMGNAGNDTFVVVPPDQTPVTVDGGADNDHLAIDNQGISVTQSGSQISLSGKAAVTFSGVEYVTSCDFASLASSDSDGDGVPDDCDVNTSGNSGSTGGDQDGTGGSSPGGGTATTGGSGTSGSAGTSGDTGGTDNPAPDDLLPAACGAGMCGFGFVPAMPLMLAGLGGFKWRLRRGRRTR